MLKPSNRAALASTLLLVFALLNASSAQNSGQKGPQALKIKIEAPELDKHLLLSKLNENGTKRGMNFELAEESFDYRIQFETSQNTMLEGSKGGISTSNKSSASTSVFDAQGKQLFTFQRANRLTDSGATNAVAKEIIKRILRWPDLRDKETRKG